MRTWSGAPMFFLLAVMHALIFWFSIGLLTPLILLVGLFTKRHKTLPFNGYADQVASLYTGMDLRANF